MKKLLIGLMVLLAATAQARQIVDVAGRTVAVPDRVERLILGEGRFLIALGLLEGKALPQKVVGTMGEFERLDPDNYALYLKHFPVIGKLPRVGQTSSESFSAEAAIALKPQVAVFGIAGHGPSLKDQSVIDQLNAAGVAVAFIDFRNDPLVNAPKSMKLLGELLGREAAARAYVDFYNGELARVSEGLKGVTKKPTVFLESRVGLREECCETMVGGMMGRFIDAAGGDNLARALVPGEVGTVNLEYLLTRQPDVYIATAIGNSTLVTTAPRRILMGAQAGKADVEASLARSLQRPGISGLRAVKQKRAHAIWHHFYDSPLNVVAVQAFARWLHPERFAKLDPNATLATLYQRFQPVPLTGTYWASLP